MFRQWLHVTAAGDRPAAEIAPRERCGCCERSRG
jgi:hypothetical protein